MTQKKMMRLLLLFSAVFFFFTASATDKELDSIITTWTKTNGKSKTTFFKDPVTFTTTQITQMLVDDEWVNVDKVVTEGEPNIATTTNYTFDGEDWIAFSRSITKYFNNNILSETTFKTDVNGDWTLLANQSYADLSNDSGVWCDILFDQNGNQIMTAEYYWPGAKQAKAIEKKVYEYAENGNCIKETTYEWNNQEWQTVSTSDYHYRKGSMVMANLIR